MTRAERDRRYKVLMYALNAEISALASNQSPMKEATKRKYRHEIWMSCYGDLPIKHKYPPLVNTVLK